jgi:hypothetical protein
MFNIITNLISLTKVAKENMQDMEILIDLLNARIKALDAENEFLRSEIKKQKQFLSRQHE